MEEQIIKELQQDVILSNFFLRLADEGGGRMISELTFENLTSTAKRLIELGLVSCTKIEGEIVRYAYGLTSTGWTAVEIIRGKTKEGK